MTKTLRRIRDGRVICEQCVIADTFLLRLRGLMGRASIAPDEGLLIQPTGEIHMFFMRFAIDAVFCTRDLTVVKVVRNLKPWRLAAARGAHLVVELAAGAAGDLAPGEELALD
jgi:uncharacterized protein